MRGSVINTFIQQGFVNLPSDSKDKISVFNKCCSFEVSVHQRILIDHGFHQNIKQNNCFQH